MKIDNLRTEAGRSRRMSGSVRAARRRIFCAWLMILTLTSCGNTGTELAEIHYQFIQQITAYQEDGGVRYHDFVAHSGVAVFSQGKVSFDAFPASGENRIELELRMEGDAFVASIDDVATRGEQNAWVRLNKPNSDTFGSNTDCEIWVGSQEPAEATEPN